MSIPIAFDYKNTGLLIRFVPSNNLDELTIDWHIPYVENEYQSQPLNYISHLFGHEG